VGPMEAVACRENFAAYCHAAPRNGERLGLKRLFA